MKVGETASFTIAASGTDLTYQWQIDRNDGKGWVNIDGATATSYTTSTVNISCNGFKYKCVVSNSAGNVESNSATLTVQDAGGSSDDKPSSGTDKKDDAPKTGDNTPSVWLFILSILSGTGVIITVKKRRENLNS